MMALAKIVFLLALIGHVAHGFYIELEQDQPELDDLLRVGKRMYIYRGGANSPSKRPFGDWFGEAESMKDAHTMVDKRSMAIGRAGMRPGKRSQEDDLPESYFPRNKFVFFEQ